MKKKLISLSVALLMLMQFAFPALATETKKTNSANAENEPQKPATFAEQTKAYTKENSVTYDKEGEYNNLRYGIKDGEVTITGYISEPSGELVIPETIEDYPVTGIGEAAFFGCTSLTSVEMSNVQMIGYEAFLNCSSLMSVEMPNIKEAAGNSFSGTTWYDNLADEFAVFGDGVLVKYCGTAKEVTIPDNVKCVASFYGNDNITSVAMSNVQAIGSHAFYNCKALTSLEIPKVQTIGDNAFAYCDSITSIKMPNVKTIDERAFSYCGALTNAEIPKVQTIGYAAFEFCSALKSVDIPKAETIGELVFYDCASLTSVKMPNVQTIGASAFENCTSLMSVEMPKVRAIGLGAFKHCGSLTSVGMWNVQRIDSEAFCYCNSLKEVYFYSNAPTSFGWYVFANCASGFTIYYAKGTSGWTTPTWKGYPTKEFEPDIYRYVTFKDGLTGEIIFTQTVEYGKDATLPTAPEHDGYYFTGWDTDPRCITSDTTITALYEINTYTVTFKDGLTGEIISRQTVEHGKDATLPTPPEHEGYSFKGWDSDGKNITADTTITAQYAISTYTVTFKDGLTGEVISTQTVEHSKDATLPTAPEHEGYSFKGWDSDGKNITADTTITALYEINTYTVTFKDGLTGEVISTQTVEHGKDAALPAAPEHDGYSFKGWDSDGKNITADTTITALYEKKSEPAPATGDINGDGKINTADAVYLLKSAAGMLELTSEQMQVADLNHDGKINTADAVMILRFVAGIITLD